jgi:thiol:disulfide interchange protein
MNVGSEIRRYVGALVMGGVVVVTGVPAVAQIHGVKAEVVPLLENDGVHPGSDVRVAVQVRLPEGLHTQSNTPRDPSLIPTVLTLDPPPGVRAVELVFPPATDLAQAGQTQPLAVFEREFVIGVRLAVSSDARPGPIEVPGRLRYQACDANLCYAPVTTPVTWSLKVVPAGTKVAVLHRDVFDAIRFGTGQQPPSASDIATGRRSALKRTEPTNGLDALEGFSTLASTGGYLGSKDFLSFVHNAEAGVKDRGMFEGRGPLAILVLVFLGGLALNLTPCVLPMIPINLAIIGAGVQAGSRMRGFMLGGVYGAAMAVVYGILGLAVITTASTFGVINASPWFNLGIAALFTVLALAMFDVIVIDFTKYSAHVSLAGAARGSFLLAFGMGAIAALLAGACVAPVVIQVVVFSSNLYAKGTASALALPFFLGIGMAVPWPIAGAGIAALPKPGHWMVRVKQVFGVAIFAMAAYYGYTAYELFADRHVDAAAVNSSVQEKLREGWHSSLAEGLAVAMREQRPVLIDFWATWCKNCLTMDQTTLKNSEVRAALARYVKIAYQAEQPDEDPAKSVMQRFNAIGLPTYVILEPKPVDHRP